MDKNKYQKERDETKSLNEFMAKLFPVPKKKRRSRNKK